MDLTSSEGIVERDAAISQIVLSSNGSTIVTTSKLSSEMASMTGRKWWNQSITIDDEEIETVDLYLGNALSLKQLFSFFAVYLAQEQIFGAENVLTRTLMPEYWTQLVDTHEGYRYFLPRFFALWLENARDSPKIYGRASFFQWLHSSREISEDLKLLRVYDPICERTLTVTTKELEFFRMKMLLTDTERKANKILFVGTGLSEQLKSRFDGFLYKENDSRLPARNGGISLRQSRLKGFFCSYPLLQSQQLVASDTDPASSLSNSQEVDALRKATPEVVRQLQGTWIYAMDSQYNFYIHKPERMQFTHMSLTGGFPVVGAGYIRLRRGQITYIDAYAPQYNVTLENFRAMLNLLWLVGANLQNAVVQGPQQFNVMINAHYGN